MGIVRRWGRKKGRDKEGKQHLSTTLLLLEYTPADPKKIAKSTRQASEKASLKSASGGGFPAAGSRRVEKLEPHLGKKETLKL